MDYQNLTEQDMEKIALDIAAQLKPKQALLLMGDLGAGKTTFTRYLAQALSIRARVQSPTFVVHRRYVTSDPEKNIKCVNHFDLYRIRHSSELTDLGLEEILNEDAAITVVEWPELIESEIKNSHYKMYFDYCGENTRSLRIVYVPDKN